MFNCRGHTVQELSPKQVVDVQHTSRTQTSPIRQCSRVVSKVQQCQAV